MFIVMYHTVCAVNQSEVLNLASMLLLYPIVFSNEDRIVFPCHFHMSNNRFVVMGT